MKVTQKGFIVHPFETSDGKYSASYGNHNKTIKSFNTLGAAKKYLAQKGIQKANYDAPSGVKEVKTYLRRKQPVRQLNTMFRLPGW